jgi:hypothetical protein
MGVATAISLGLAAVGTGMSVYQGIKGASDKAKADAAAVNAANDLQRIQEQDKFAALQVPTLGLELAQENIQARQSENVRALKESGAAGVLGGLTAANQQAQAQDLQLAAQADQMQAQRDQMQAQNAQQIESNRIQRQVGLAGQRLEGAQKASALGQGQIDTAIQGGISNLANAAFSAQYFGGKGKPIDDTTNPKSINPDAAAKTAPGVAAQSYQQPGATALPMSPSSGYNWQAGNNQFKAAINPATLNQTTFPGLTSGQTGDGLNDMYYRK